MDNFWTSSQYKWLNHQYHSSKKIAQSNDEEIFPSDSNQKHYVLVHYLSDIRNVGTKIQAHQRVIASAMIYYKRFYALNGILDCDPILLVPACLLLASKIEECPLNAKTLHQISMGKETTQSYDSKDFTPSFPYQLSQILECELYLMEQLSFNLTVYHPYNSLISFLKDSEMSENLYQNSWNIVNDSYFCEVVLKYPPYLIALTAIYMTCLMKDEKDKIRKWFDQLYVDMKQIGEISEEIINMYYMFRDMNDVNSNVNKQLIQGLEKVKEMRKNSYWTTV
ncbi:hypothetical protein ABK040_010142 [Willaertia magna]